MKTTPLLTALLASVLGLMPFAAPAQTSSDMVRIEVRVASEQDRKELKGTSADTVTQKKTLHIALSGKPKSPETRTGTWTAYGRNLKNHNITVLELGEFKIDLPASGQQKIESKVISTTSTPEHSVSSRGGGGGSSGGSSSRGRSKKVEAQGTRYIGYGIVVKDGAKVVGEAFDPTGLKQEAAK